MAILVSNEKRKKVFEYEGLSPHTVAAQTRGTETNYLIEIE
jgi:hypothetical protein